MKVAVVINIAKAILALLSCQLLPAAVLSQDSVKSRKVSLHLFVDTYYAYDFSQPANQEKPPFFYSHHKHDAFNVNLALAGFTFRDSMKKVNLGIMAGTYPQKNLASEPGILRHIYEANVGFRISRSKEIWIEAGILPSHIGFETAISKDCSTLTRSIMAENSPYYEAGLKMSVKSKNNKWYLAAMLLNGWQKIRRTNGNSAPAFGTQVTYSPAPKFSINCSHYVGTELPDTARQWRYFQNLYASWQMQKGWSLVGGLDIGFQQKARDAKDLNFWFTPVLIAQYKQQKWAAAARLEYYQDDKGVIIPLVNAQPFRVFGYSINLDRSFAYNILWRLEGRWLKSTPAYFLDDAELRPHHFSVTTSLAVSFKR